MKKTLNIVFYLDNINLYDFVDYFLESLTMEKNEIVEVPSAKGEKCEYFAFCSLTNDMLNSFSSFKISKLVKINNQDVFIVINMEIVEGSPVLTISLNKRSLLLSFKDDEGVNKYINDLIANLYTKFKFNYVCYDEETKYYKKNTEQC